MIYKIILILILTSSLAMASEPQGTEVPVSGQDNIDIIKAAQETGQNQTANNSLFLEDFNSVNNPYKETLFATGQGQRNQSINSYENLTDALAAFLEKYEDERPQAIASD